MTWFVPVNRAAASESGGEAASDALMNEAVARARIGEAADVQPISGPIGLDFRSGALESALHWQVIWPRAIAMAWADDDFRDALIADPRGVIEETFGYHLSENLDLTIEQATAGTFERESITPGEDDPWAGLPKLKLTLAIPPRPSQQLQAVAITAYQDTGRTYPFTCC
jgi:ribosomally synthesized peptide (two-chain TOMM family)